MLGAFETKTVAGATLAPSPAGLAQVESRWMRPDRRCSRSLSTCLPASPGPRRSWPLRIRAGRGTASWASAGRARDCPQSLGASPHMCQTALADPSHTAQLTASCSTDRDLRREGRVWRRRHDLLYGGPELAPRSGAGRRLYRNRAQWRRKNLRHDARQSHPCARLVGRPALGAHRHRGPLRQSCRVPLPSGRRDRQRRQSRSLLSGRDPLHRAQGIPAGAGSAFTTKIAQTSPSTT